MTSVRSAIRPSVSGAIISPLARRSRLSLPRSGLLAYIVGGIDTIGLSFADYADVDESVRAIFFSDEETLVDAATAYAAALGSEFLNFGTMIGTEENGVALYASDTDMTILRRAYRYFGIPWPYPDATDAFVDGPDVLVDGTDQLVDVEVS